METLSILPPELWGRILGHLSLSELAAAELVSRGWRDFVRRHAPLWRRHLDAFRSSPLDPMIRDFAARIPPDCDDGRKMKKAICCLILATGKLKRLKEEIGEVGGVE